MKKYIKIPFKKCMLGQLSQAQMEAIASKKSEANKKNAKMKKIISFNKITKIL